MPQSEIFDCDMESRARLASEDIDKRNQIERKTIAEKTFIIDNQ